MDVLTKNSYSLHTEMQLHNHLTLLLSKEAKCQGGIWVKVCYLYFL